MIDKIMTARGLSKSSVMDELGLPRLNGSIWMSKGRGTNVNPEVLGRVLMWFKANRAIWDVTA